MQIALMTIQFQLPGCHSLKEKRGRLRGLKDRFGRLTNLAVSETDSHDNHQLAQWSFVVISQQRRQGEQVFDQIEQFAANRLDAVVVNSQREWL